MERKISNWYTGWKSKTFEICYHTCGYEDGYGRFDISMFGWHSCIKLPFKSKLFPNGDCDEPRYGIVIYNGTVYLYYGGSGNLGNKKCCKSFDLPFFTYKHIRHDIECVQPIYGDIDETCIYTMVPYDLIYDKDYKLTGNYTINKYTTLYTDSYDNTKVACTYWIEEREWRPKWLTWTSIFKKVRRYIEISFDNEIGKEKGSWKGGVTGCSYNLLPNETAHECLRRMELNEKF